MKLILLSLATAFLFCGYSALKQMAPNQWNATWYEADTFTRGQNMIGIGIGGALPWGKQ